MFVDPRSLKSVTNTLQVCRTKVAVRDRMREIMTRPDCGDMQHELDDGVSRLGT